MTHFGKVRQLGFHADLIEDLIRQVNGGELPQHNLFQLETTFDDDSVFRHFDYLGLRGKLLTSIHLDELSEGVRWHVSLQPVSQMTGIEVGRFSHDAAPEHLQDPAGEWEDASAYLAVALSFTTNRAIELESLQCDNPSCTVDHGFVGSSKDEGLLMHFGTGAEGSSEEDAMAFVSALAAEVSNT